MGDWIKAVQIAKAEELINNKVSLDAQEIAMAHTHYGILPIWFIVVIAFIVFGMILDHKNNK